MGHAKTATAPMFMDLLNWVGSKTGPGLSSRLVGGEKQRAATPAPSFQKPDYSSLTNPPKLDPVLAKRLLHLFMELNLLGTTVFLATHDLKLVSQGKAPAASRKRILKPHDAQKKFRTDPSPA